MTSARSWWRSVAACGRTRGRPRAARRLPGRRRCAPPAAGRCCCRGRTASRTARTSSTGGGTAPPREPERAERDPRARPLGGLDARGARAEPRRGRARAPPAAGLPVRVSLTHRVRALRRGPVRRDDRHEHRLGAVPVRVRRPSVPDARDPDRRLDRPDGAGASGAARTTAASPPAGRRSRARSTTSARPRAIGATRLDHCFTDLERDGTASPASSCARRTRRRR